MARVICPNRARGRRCAPENGRHFNEKQARKITRRLLRWGRDNFKHYPWRTEDDPWLSFLAEFLLQRTRASQVASVFMTVRDKLPTAQSLASGGLVAVNELTSKLGLHWRGPLLLRTAEVVAACGGAPPETVVQLRSLPGVGMYTAAAWLSLHRGKRAVIIDANVARWLSRMTGLPYNRDPRHVRWVKEVAERLTPGRAFRDYNYAVLDFTMSICVPRNPNCRSCPLLKDCRYGRGLGADPSASLTLNVKVKRSRLTVNRSR